MVHEIQQYKDPVSGKIFDDKYDAIKSELKSIDIKHTFESFYSNADLDNTNFVNGDYCLQRDKTFYNRLLDSIIFMAYIYESHITGSGPPLTRETKKGQSYLGRCLSESNSQLYKWFHVQMCICPVCYREYGQPYYALNCEHNDNIPIKE